MADQAPFFVVGAGRSGTTLLRLILAGHSRLHIPPETWFLRSLVRDFPLTGALTQPQFERAIATMVQHERWPDMGLPEDALRRQAAELVKPALVDLIDLVYRHLLQCEWQAAPGRQDAALFRYRAGTGEALSGGKVHLFGPRWP